VTSRSAVDTRSQARSPHDRHLHRTASVVVLGGINAAKALDDPSEAFVDNVAASRALVEPDWLENRSTRQPRSLHT
jgi:hypothetical protein